MSHRQYHTVILSLYHHFCLLHQLWPFSPVFSVSHMVLLIFCREHFLLVDFVSVEIPSERLTLHGLSFFIVVFQLLEEHRLPPIPLCSSCPFSVFLFCCTLFDMLLSLLYSWAQNICRLGGSHLFFVITNCMLCGIAGARQSAEP